MVTYNHENYIEQAIESVLMQKTSFPIKLFIGEDCSSDKTATICLKYQVKHPEIIEVILNKENIGASNNAKQIFEKCFSSGAKYIAMLEGDDYWTDPYKLQKQVDFLEANNDVSLCFHRAFILRDGKFELHKIPNVNKEEIEYIDILSTYNFITTASVVFRKARLDVTKCHYENSLGDLNLYFLLSRKGPFKCIEEVMSVYRLHDGGLWSGISRLKQNENYLSFYKAIYSKLDPDEKQVVSTKVRKIINEICLLKYSNNLKRTIMFPIKMLTFYYE